MNTFDVKTPVVTSTDILNHIVTYNTLIGSIAEKLQQHFGVGNVVYRINNKDKDYFYEFVFY